MTTVNQPDVTVNILAANTQVENTAQKVLFVGQKTVAGSAVSGALQTNIGNDNSWDTLSGVNSMGAGMIRDARKINKDVRFDAIFLDDAVAATPAVGTITITGTASETGSVIVSVGSERNHSYNIPVTINDTETVVGQAIADAITSDSEVPVTAANAVGVVTLTAVNGGTVGNSMGVKVEGEVAGIAFAVVAMSGGATDPDLTSVFDVIADQRYQTIVWPYVSDIATLKDFLDTRFNSTNIVLDGVGIVSAADTFANLVTLLDGLNSQSVAVHADELITEATYAGPALFELGYSVAAQFAAIRSLRLEVGTDISQFVITRNGARDSFGGPALASKPYFNTPLQYLPQIDIGKGFDRLEVETLGDSGGFVIGNNVSGTSSRAGEVLTTYKTDVAGNPDISFKYLNYVDTISNIREFYFNNLRNRFAQSRLTEGALIRGRDIANKALVEAFCTQLFTELSGDDFVLTQSGEESLQFFIKNLVVTLDLSTGTVTINMVIPIVTQLRTILATVQIAFSTNG